MLHYDLFAGIGGFSIAVDEVFGPGRVQHVFAETNNFCRAVLRKHWPSSVIHNDVRNVEKIGGDERDYTSVVTGGFPCQPFSHSGSRRGTEDDRYLWPAMFEVIDMVRPGWVIAENVFGLVTWQRGVVLDRVCADLEGQGYEVQPVVLPAAAVGAPHRRDRTWVIAAHPDAGGKRRESESIDGVPYQHQVTVEAQTVRSSWVRPWQAVAAATGFPWMDDGIPHWLDGSPISYEQWRKASIHAYGNAIVPAVAVEILKAVDAAWL